MQLWTHGRGGRLLQWRDRAARRPSRRLPAEDGRWLRLTVIDLDDTDAAAINALADRLGTDRVRVVQADPHDLSAWGRLRADLVALHDSQPGVLWSSPSADRAYRCPPVVVRLKAFAEDVAARLPERHGDFVELTVGVLPYPPGSRPAHERRPEDARTPVDPAELHIEPAGPLAARSGETVRTDILLTNLSDQESVVRNNGHVTHVSPTPRTAGSSVGTPGGNISRWSLSARRQA